MRMSSARKKMQCSVNPHFGLDELGEQITHKEISREILRRLSLRDKAIQL